MGALVGRRAGTGDGERTQSGERGPVLCRPSPGRDPALEPGHAGPRPPEPMARRRGARPRPTWSATFCAPGRATHHSRRHWQELGEDHLALAALAATLEPVASPCWSCTVPPRNARRAASAGHAVDEVGVHTRDVVLAASELLEQSLVTRTPGLDRRAPSASGCSTRCASTLANERRPAKRDAACFDAPRRAAPHQRLIHLRAPVGIIRRGLHGPPRTVGAGVVVGLPEPWNPVHPPSKTIRREGQHDGCSCHRLHRASAIRWSRLRSARPACCRRTARRRRPARLLGPLETVDATLAEVDEPVTWDVEDLGLPNEDVTLRSTARDVVVEVDTGMRLSRLNTFSRASTRR